MKMTFKDKLAGAVVIALAVCAGVIVSRMDLMGTSGNSLPKAYNYDDAAVLYIDPELITYKLAATISTGMSDPRGIAIGIKDRICIAGDEEIRIFDSSGDLIDVKKMEGLPQALTIGPDGKCFVAMKDHIEVFDPWKWSRTAWPVEPEAVFVSVAAGKEDVFAADIATGCVIRYDYSGKILNRIGDGQEQSALNIIGGNFAAALAPNGKLWITDTGKLRVDNFSYSGMMEEYWGVYAGEAEPFVAGFVGCCNPVKLAFLSDGSFVTSEKRSPRMKIYSPGKEFLTVVAGPSAFSKNAAALDIAVDSKDRILVLDTKKKMVLIFVKDSHGKS